MLERKYYSNPAISQIDKLVGRLPNIFGRRPDIALKTVLSSPYQALLMLESKFYSNPAISLLSQVGGEMCGWVLVGGCG